MFYNHTGSHTLNVSFLGFRHVKSELFCFLAGFNFCLLGFTRWRLQHLMWLWAHNTLNALNTRWNAATDHQDAAEGGLGGSAESPPQIESPSVSPPHVWLEMTMTLTGMEAEPSTRQREAGRRCVLVFVLAAPSQLSSTDAAVSIRAGETLCVRRSGFRTELEPGRGN